MKVYVSQNDHESSVIRYRKDKQTYRFVMDNDLIEALASEWIKT